MRWVWQCDVIYVWQFLLPSCSFSFNLASPSAKIHQTLKSLVLEGRMLWKRRQHTVKNICFQYKWQTKLCTTFVLRFCFVIYKKGSSKHETGSFPLITFIIKKTPTTHIRTHTESNINRRIITCLPSFRVYHTKTLTGRSQAGLTDGSLNQ